ncbi:MAG: sigma-70 family RNA polymerase sigma factor [Flavobacteriales bacterium]|nr:sigma-70 family RNA polymerase sigma factor [Flavobacteriales bacterium]
MSKRSPVSDQELIEMYRNSHDLKYVGELYQRYTHIITIICLKYLKNQDDAQDAAMDLFEVLCRDLKKHQVKQFKSWLATVTKNLCIKKLRRSSHDDLKEGMAVAEETVVEISGVMDPNVIKEEQLSRLEKLIEEIPAEQATCIKLFYLEEKSYEDIAGITGYSMNEVKSYLQNGKRNLRIRMQKPS